MDMQRKVNNAVKFISAVETLGVCAIILMAFFFQLAMSELPCPLCLLQRLGLLGIAFGFMLNIRYHVRPSHYSLSLLSAVLTAFISLRQIALHITTPTGYGSSFLGMHMYTWVFVLSFIAIVYIAIVMSYPRQYEMNKDKRQVAEAKGHKTRIFTHVVFAIFTAIIVANLISTYAECGLSQCPDNPVSYTM